MTAHAPARHPLGDAHVRRPLLGDGVQRALPAQPGQGADRAVGRLRPAHPDRLRRRPRAGARRGRQGRGADRAHRRHARAVRRDPARRDEHLDDHQRHRDVAAGALRGRRRGAGREPGVAAGHHAERHHQGVPLPRHVRLPARALAAAHHRHDRLHRRRDPQVEPDQHLQLPPAGGRRDAGPGDRVRDGDRDRRARRGARLRPGPRRPDRRRRRADLVLRQRRRALRRGDVQDARVRRAVGRPHPRALRRHRTPSSGGSATASRSTPSASPRRSRRTTSSASCWRCSR